MSRKTFLILLGSGLLSGYLVNLLVLNGIAVKWERLPAPPVGEFDLHSIDEFQLSILGEDGKFFHWDLDSWQPGQIPKEDSYLTLEEDISTCNNADIPFWPTSNAPHGITDCIQATWIYIEWSDKLIYAIDQDREVWRWYLSNHIIDDMFRFASFLYVGGFLVPLGGSVVFGVKKYLKERKQRRFLS